MNQIPPNLASQDERPRLKQSHGWFAAGESFSEALKLLSDGAFRLFAYLCIRADRQTGSCQLSQRSLARSLGKSRRILGRYVEELKSKQVCWVESGTNQFAVTRFEIMDAYWPYHRTPPEISTVRGSDYVESVRQAYLSLGCGLGQFSPAESRRARQLETRGISLATVEDAFLLGACRKYVSWMNGAASAPIGSLAYFEPLIGEIQNQPLADSHRAHLKIQLKRLETKWAKMQSEINSATE
jgi:hypothetical protein